jgi:hypothetical protein
MNKTETKSGVLLKHHLKARATVSEMPNAVDVGLTDPFSRAA